MTACLRRGCETELHDVSGRGLARLGYQLFLCEQGGPEGATSTEPRGQVWLYRASKGELVRAAHLATLGESAKYYRAESFSLLGAEERVLGDKHVLRLEYRLSSSVGGGAMCGSHASDSTVAAFCVAEAEPDRACRVIVPLRTRLEFTPNPGCDVGQPAPVATLGYRASLGPGWVDVTPVRPPADSGDASAGDPQGIAGRHALW
ncbi:MAG: hypothetical protein JNJ54_22385 [Myxococcaceae bacterium]|nr:hypothetical protein [Myxococcaceae bacterium]